MLCPACHQDQNQEILHLDGLPVLCNALWPDAVAARSCPRGEMRLHACGHCGLLFNAAFDPDLMTYAAGYETSLHFSPTFQTFASDLARSLVLEHDLAGSTVIEIGCGRGEFLVELADAGMGHCLGFDRSFDPGLVELPARVEIQPRYYSEVSPRPHADLVCSRHVLEHVSRPSELLDELSEALTPSGLLYLEVPNALYTLEDGGIWDLIYEHCNYFTKASLEWLLAERGFTAIQVRSGFGGQFLSSWSRRSGAPRQPKAISGGQHQFELAKGLATLHDTKVRSFEATLSQALMDGQRVAIWGAGSKGVSFLNALASGDQIDAAIDRNPRKQGKYLPGTGQSIQSPEEACRSPLDLVFVMNPIYASEIETQLRELGSEAHLVLV